MPGSGATASFLRKKANIGDRVYTVLSIMVSAATFDLGKTVHAIKVIDFISVGANSYVSSGSQRVFNQNKTAAGTTVAGQLSGSGFTANDNFVLTVYGLG